SPLKPQRLTPANAKIIEDRQKQPLRVGSNCLQHALSLLRGQRPAPGALGSLGPNQRDRWVALNQPFRIGRSKDRLQGSDDVVDLRLAGPSKTVDEFLDLRSEEHTSELQSRFDLVCRLLLEKKKKK